MTFNPLATTVERLTGERDRARDTAVRFEQENAYLLDQLQALKLDAPHIRPEDVVERIGQIQRSVAP